MKSAVADLDPEQIEWLAEKRGLAAIWPYVVGLPDERGERIAHCPLHPDENPSMHINLSKGVWYCHSGCGGGTVGQLLDAQDTWLGEDEHPGLAARSRVR